MKLLAKNTKLEKGEKLGILTYGLSLAPHKLSGFNLCPFASKGCIESCLNLSGMGIFSNVQSARIDRAKFFNSNPKEFLKQLEIEIDSAWRKAEKLNLKLAIRPNVLSDVAWEKLGIIQNFPSIQFYDYTKNPIRMLQFTGGLLPENYHLTFSRAENNQARVEAVIRNGGNVAAVFAGELPGTYLGKPVIDGDLSDARFLDPQGVIVGLKAKGKAKKDESGFVLN